MANKTPNKNVKSKVKKNRLKEMGSELKKVSFPSFSTTVKQTGVVIAIVLLFAVVLLGVDSLLSFLYTKLLGL